MNTVKKILFPLLAVAIFFSPIMGAAADVPRSRTLIIAQGYDPYHLWPNGSTASVNLSCGQAIVEPIVWVDPKTGKTEGLLAESWKMINSTTWQIKLRKGISFTNGEPMNADALKFSAEIIMDKTVTPAYNRDFGLFERVEKVDEYTVNIHTSKPYAPMLSASLPRLYVIPPKYWKEIGGAAKFTFKPIGTGPYVLKEWVKDDRIVMDKNDKYWGKLPKGIDRIIWKPVPDDTARAAGLETGEFDLIANMSVNSVPRVEAHPKLNLLSVSSERVYEIGLSNIDTTPLANQKVRQALNYAVDNATIVKNLFMGKAAVLQGQLLVKGQIGFNPKLKPYPYDSAKAKKLLAEAGYPNGFEITFQFPAGRYAQDKEVSEAVAGMLGKVGVKCKMVQLEGGEFLKKLVAKELRPMHYGGWATGPDPHPMMAQYRSDWRYSIYNNTEVDKLIDQGATEMDLKKREAIYHKLTEIMYDDCPVIFMFQGVDFYGATKRLKNWAPRGDQMILLYGISLED